MEESEPEEEGKRDTIKNKCNSTLHQQGVPVFSRTSSFHNSQRNSVIPEEPATSWRLQSCQTHSVRSAVTCRCSCLEKKKKKTVSSLFTAFHTLPVPFRQCLSSVGVSLVDVDPISSLHAMVRAEATTRCLSATWEKFWVATPPSRLVFAVFAFHQKKRRHSPQLTRTLCESNSGIFENNGML